MQDLSSYTSIHAPGDVSKLIDDTLIGDDYLSIASEFRFRRTRDLLDDPNAGLTQWLSDEAANWAASSDIHIMRDRIEAWWTGGDELDYPPLDELTGKAKIRLSDNVPPLYQLKPYGNPANANDWAVLEHGKHVIIEVSPDPRSPIYFMASPLGASPLQPPDLSPNSSAILNYKTFWANVGKIERVYPDPKIANFTQMERIDLSVSAIIERYAAIEAEREMLVKAEAKLNLDMPEVQGDQVAILARLDEVRLMITRRAALERLVSALQGRAAEKGFHLEIKGDTINQPPAPDIVLTKGRIYQRFQFIHRWVEAVQRSRTRGGLFGTSRRTWTEYHHLTKEVIGYREIHGTDSQVTRYIEDNLQNFDVRILRLTPLGYFTQDDVALTDILDLCEIDPSFRATCALLVPEYDQTLFGDDVVTGYRVIRKPQRGRRLRGLPHIQLEEHVSYRMRWRGCELGELNSSIALMPGEERVINIKTVRRSMQEYEIRSTNVAEMEASSSTDTLSSVETEFSRENSSERTSSWSARGKVVGNGWSGGADAKGDSRKSAREFAKTLNRLTNQAVNKMRKASRQEVISRELTRVEAENTMDSNGRITNPNVGRTLNINFFNVNNIYAVGTFLSDLEILYRSPFEMIDGTGIEDIRYYRLSELDRFWSDYNADMRRIVTRALRSDDRSLMGPKLEQDFEPIKANLAANVRNALQRTVDEYDIESTSLDKVSAFSFGNGMLKLAEADGDTFEDMVKRMRETGMVIDETLITAPSGAIYADSVLGQAEALESYAVDLRRLEVERSLTTILRERHQLGAPGPDVQRRVFDNISFERDNETLRLTLGATPPSGTWQLMLDSLPVAILELTPDQKRYEVTIPEALRTHDWLDQANAILVRIAAP